MSIRKRFHLRFPLFVLAASLLIAGLVVWPVVRELRQEAKDQALIAAIKKNDGPAVVRLLNAGADANARDVPRDKRPFWRLCWELLRGRRASKDSQSLTALQVVIDSIWLRNKSGPHWIPPDMRIVRALLEHGANPNAGLDAPDSSGRHWPLYYALKYRSADKEVSKEWSLLLIQHGAQLTLTDSGIQWPLLEAAAEGSADPSVLKAMLDKGADINAQDLDGRTALIGAALAGNVSNVRLLLAYHADVAIKDSDGHTALASAAADHYGGKANLSDYRQIIHLLRQAGAR